MDEGAMHEEGDGADIEMNGLVNGLEIVDTQKTAAFEQNAEGAAVPNLSTMQPNEANHHQPGVSSTKPEAEAAEDGVYRSRNPSPLPYLLQSSSARQTTPRPLSPSTPIRPGPLNLKADNTHRTDTPSTEADENTDASMTDTLEVDIERRIGAEGPLTPRNDVGPFVFDGGSGNGGVALLSSRRGEGSENSVS